MSICSTYRDLLWDHVYGLLEPAEAEPLREHLATCPVCQSQLATLRADRIKLKQAALVDTAVPEFVAPAELPSVLTFRPIFAREFRTARAWLRPLAAAAAVLLLVALPYGLYRSGLAQHQAAVADARGRLVEAESQRDDAQ